MKSMADLQKIKDQMADKMPGGKGGARVLVGLATCGIAAGAGAVMEEFEKAVAEKGLKNVTVSRTGCVGVCQYEPVVEVWEPNGARTTYVNVDAVKARRVAEEHLAGGKIVNDLTIGASMK